MTLLDSKNIAYFGQLSKPCRPTKTCVTSCPSHWTKVLKNAVQKWLVRSVAHFMMLTYSNGIICVLVSVLELPSVIYRFKIGGDGVAIEWVNELGKL